MVPLCDRQLISRDRPPVRTAHVDGQRRLPKVEITPAMLTAASEALEAHYLGEGVYDLRDSVIKELYLAMKKARQLSDRPFHRTALQTEGLPLLGQEVR